MLREGKESDSFEKINSNFEQMKLQCRNNRRIRKVRNKNNVQNLRHNETIDTLLNRRSIRAFCNEAIDEDTVATLETVAQRAACSQFLNDWSAIKITNSSIKQKLSEIGNQTYIATAPLLYVFIIDQHRNAAIAQKNGIDTGSDEFMLKNSLPLYSSSKRRHFGTSHHGNCRGIFGSWLRNPRFNFEQ